MKKNLLFLAFCFVFAGTYAQSLSGNWAVTYDQDVPGKTLKNKPIAIVELKTDAATGTVYSTIKSLQNGYASSCQNCPGDNANRQTVGMTWCKGLKAVPGKPGEFNGGWAIDAQTGKVANDVVAKMVNPTTIVVTCSESDTGKARTVTLTKQ